MTSPSQHTQPLPTLRYDDRGLPMLPEPSIKPRTQPLLDVEKASIVRLLNEYKARANEFTPGSWADGHISGAIEALERILLMELE